MKALRPATLLLAALGTVLALVLLLAAEPREVLALVRQAKRPELFQALLWASGIVTARGLRLRLVVGPRVSALRAAAVMALSQLAIAVVPLRLGELALLPLLRVAGVPGTLRAVSILVFLRFLDVASLLTLAVIAGLTLGVSTATAAAALAVLLLLSLLAVATGLRSLRLLARQWRSRRGLRRRVLRKALQLRREWRQRARSPLRLAALALCSLAAWFGLWGLTVALLRAMGFAWPVGHVLLGMLGATLGASLPINAVGNFGSLEGGWAAALSLVGVSPAEALASGFATHLYSLLFTASFGAAGALVLAVTSAESGPRNGAAAAMASRNVPRRP